MVFQFIIGCTFSELNVSFCLEGVKIADIFQTILRNAYFSIGIFTVEADTLAHFSEMSKNGVKIALCQNEKSLKLRKKIALLRLQ